MASALPSLDRILSPVSPRVFFDRFFEKQPLVLQRRDARLYQGLLSTADVEAITFAGAARPDASLFHLARGGRALSTSPPLVDEKSRLRMGEVLQRYAQGFTIVLNQLERRWLPLARLCASVEHSFASAPVQLKALWANSYLTPPRAQGYPAHYDDHDVIVLQLEGAKRWNVYAPLAESPLEPRAGIPAEELGEPVHALELGPGDLVYLPRGHPHEAATGPEHSLHVTIALWPLTWLDLVTTLARATPALRRAAVRPPAGERDPSAWWERALGAGLAALLDGPRIEAAVREAERKYVRDLAPPPGDHLRQINLLDAVDLDTPLRKPPEDKPSLARHGNELHLAAPGRILVQPPELEESLRLVIESDEFCARALPVPFFAEEKLRLARELIAHGFLVATHPGPASADLPAPVADPTARGRTARSA